MSLAIDPIRRFSLAQLVSVGGGWVEWIGLFAAALALAGGLLATRLVEPLDALFYDAVVRVTPRTPDPRILIVRIDDPSLRSEGRWPWSRTLHASLIDRLSASGVASIGYDVLFVETGPGDDALAAAISRAGRVALPLLIEVPGDNGALFRETRPVVASASTGHVIVRADADGVFRRIVPVERAGAAADAVAARFIVDPIDEDARRFYVHHGLREAASDVGGRMYIRIDEVLDGEA